MPRLPRISIEGSLYYVTSISNYGDNMFRDEKDYETYLELLKRYKSQYGFKLFSFALMPKQLNLLIELKEGVTISVIMQAINSSYTKYFNGRYSRKGHLFQQRFKSVIVEKAPYLLDMISYIHQGPVGQGYAKSPSEYVYSSHLLYMCETEKATKEAEKIKSIVELKDEIQETLDMIAKVFPDKKNYAGYLAGVTQEELKGLDKQLHRAGILGSEEFVEKVKSQLTTKVKQKQKQAFPVIPFASASIIVLLSSVILGVWYVKNNIVAKEKEISERIVRETLASTTSTPLEQQIYERLKKRLEEELVLLDNTEWKIELKPSSGIGVQAPVSDKIVFKESRVSSDNLLAKGFNASNYTLTIDNEEKIIWETIQSMPGSSAFWRGEIKEGMMKGIMSLREAESQPQDFSFVGIRTK